MRRYNLLKASVEDMAYTYDPAAELSDTVRVRDDPFATAGRMFINCLLFGLSSF